MSDISVREVVQRVRGSTLVCRTGILLLPKQQLGNEGSIAAQWQLEPIDYASWRYTRTGEGEKFLRLSQDTLLHDVEAICSSDYRFDCVLLYNFDLALAYLEVLDRRYVWRYLRDNFRKRPVGLIVAMPGQAHHLLPSEADQDLWRRGKRLVRLG